MIERVQSGDNKKIKASDYNQMASASEQVQEWQHAFGKQNLLSKSNNGNVLIDGCNDSDNGIGIFIPVKLTVPVPLLSSDDIAYSFNSKRPAFKIEPATEETESFAITQDKISSKEVGLVILQGVTNAKIKINDADHKYVKVSSTGELESSDTGSCCILWKAATSGTVWAVLQLGGSSASTGDTYKGYFKVIQTAANKIKIVNGKDESASIAGKINVNYFPVSVNALELIITKSGFIYLQCGLVGNPATNATGVIIFSDTEKQSVSGDYYDLISRVDFADSAISDFNRENVNKNIVMGGGCS